MNESFMRKVYENPTENVMQQGLNLSLIHISEPTRH